MLDVARRTDDPVAVTGTAAGTTATQPSAAALILLGALAAGVVAQGGYYTAGRVLLTAGVALAAVTAAVAARGTAAAVAARGTAAAVAARGTAAAVAAAAGIGLWIIARAVVAGAGYPFAAAAVATVATVVLGAGPFGRLGAADRERCAGALIGIGALVGATAWAGVAFRLPRFAILVEHKLWRGASTLTYPNAAAALLVPLALLALAFLATRPRRPVPALAAYLSLVGVGAAMSRAGFIALAAGLVVLAIAAPGGRTGRGRIHRLVGAAPRTAWHVAGPLVGAVVAVAALAPSMPAGGRPYPWVAVVGLAVGAGIAAGLTALAGGWRALGLTGVAAAAGAFALSQRGAGHLQAIVASRGNLDSAGRSNAWGAAVDLIAHHFWTGTGMGRAAFVWKTPDGNGALAIYAHNEYLQATAELGAVGAVLLLLLLVALAVTVHRGRTTTHRPGVRAGAVAALAALAVHSGFDFLWHLAVLPLVAGLLVGLAAPAIRQESTNIHINGEATQ